MGDNSGPPVEWSDIPLLKYLAEVFIQCGAWKNIYEMENPILLNTISKNPAEKVKYAIDKYAIVSFLVNIARLRR